MPESFSLNDLFKIGTSKDQFRLKFEELKNNKDFSSKYSIFDNEDIFGSLDNIFSNADSNDDGIIDNNEFDIIKNKFQDNNQEEISENDFKLLYQEAMYKKYSKLSPAQMYNTAMNGVGDIKESHYIEDLDNSIKLYENLSDMRQVTSNTRIADLENQIDAIVRKHLKENSNDTSKYEKLIQDSKAAQNELNANQIKLQQKQRELQTAQKEAKRLEKEINGLKDNSDKNEVDINSRTYELNELQGKIYNLSNEIGELKAKQSNLSSSLKSVNKDISKIQNKIISENKESAAEIKELKAKIALEKKSSEQDIKNYANEISSIKSAREYAYNKLTSTVQSQSEQLNYPNDGKNVASLKDVNYSAEKGQKLAQDMRNHAVGFIGYCSRHVSNGLERTGLGHERMASAHMMDTELDKNKNFRRITVTSAQELKSLPAGCIIVYEAGAAGYNSTHGHIEVTLGDGTACSDGITRNMRYSDRMSVFVPVE